MLTLFILITHSFNVSRICPVCGAAVQALSVQGWQTGQPCPHAAYIFKGKTDNKTQLRSKQDDRSTSPSCRRGALEELSVLTWGWLRTAHLSRSTWILSMRAGHQAVKRARDNGKDQCSPKWKFRAHPNSDNSPRWHESVGRRWEWAELLTVLSSWLKQQLPSTPVWLPNYSCEKNTKDSQEI